MIMLALYQDGRAEIVSPSRIFQGTDTERIIVLSPYPATVPLQIAITKPDGTNTGYAPMQSIEIPAEYVGLSAWSYSPRDTLTGQYGTAYINLLARLPATETSGRNLTSFMCELTIEESTLPTLPSEPTPDVYEQILDYLAAYGERINNIENRLDTLEKAEVTGVKGAAETEYRQGDVNITPADIGLGDVDNTSDMNKPVSTLQAQAIETAKQEAITTAQQNAEAYANTVAETAKQEAITAANQYTDTKAQAAIQEAVAEANAYTDSQIGEKVGTTVNVGGVAQNSVSFASDPQTQLNALKNSVVGTKVITFTASQFTNGTLTFTPAQTGMINNQFIVNVERLTANGYQLTANTAVKGTDGSLTLTYNTAFDGRVVIQGNGTLPLKEGAQLLNAPGTSDIDGYTQAAVNGIISNPNLIINPDFRINQRGQNSYTGYVYGADRWIGNTGTTAEPLEDGGIKLTRSSTGNGILQRIENWKTLVGKTITFSVKCREVISGEGMRCTIYIGTTTYIGNIVRTNGAISTLTITVPDTATRIECFINPINASQVIIDYAKLEIGSVATAFTPPNIAEELPKCQRYYYDVCYGINPVTEPFLSPYGLGNGIVYSATTAYFNIPFPTTMRLPLGRLSIITDTSKMQILETGGIKTVNSLSIVGANNGNATLLAGGTFTVGNSALLRIASGNVTTGILAFDAEL